MMIKVVPNALVVTEIILGSTSSLAEQHMLIKKIRYNLDNILSGKTCTIFFWLFKKAKIEFSIPFVPLCTWRISNYITVGSLGGFKIVSDSIWDSKSLWGNDVTQVDKSELFETASLAKIGRFGRPKHVDRNVELITKENNSSIHVWK